MLVASPCLMIKRPVSFYLPLKGGLARPELPCAARYARLLVAGCLAAWFAWGECRAAVVAALSPSRADVGAAVTAAREGDVVEIPAGTASWTTALVVTKSLTIKGAGIGETVILDDIVGSKQDEQAVITFQTTQNRYYRLSGISIEAGSVSTILTGGAVRVTGTTKTFRIDNCRFANLRNRSVFIQDAAVGLIDHCIFNSNGRQSIVVFHDEWGGKTFGDGSWAMPVDWGTTNAVYIEESTFVGSTGHIAVIDSFAGARWVFRYNSVNNMYLDGHGAGSTGRNRGLRSYEIYGNRLFGSTQVLFGEAIHSRGGTGVIWSNTASAYLKFATVANYRSHDYFEAWGGADGTSGWDLNDPVVYATGQHTGNNGSPLLVVDGANWSLNQWTGYTIQNVTKARFSLVSTNSANALGYIVGSQSGMMTFDTGDTFQIRRVLDTLDQVGISTGDLLVGDAPTPRWLYQQLEPVYEWANTNDGKNGQIVTKYPSIIEGVHFYNDTKKPGYVPLEFPHPLSSGVSQLPRLDPPTNLRVSK